MADRIAELKASGSVSAIGSKQGGYRIDDDDYGWYHKPFNPENGAGQNAAGSMIARQLLSDVGSGTKAAIETISAIAKAVGPQTTEPAEPVQDAGALHAVASTFPAVPVGSPIQSVSSILEPPASPALGAVSPVPIAAPLPPQETQVYFTDSQDSLVGSPEGTNFIGNELTVQSYDRITGIDGFNSAYILLNASPNSNGPLSFIATNIDRISIAFSDSATATPVSISAKRWTEVTEFWVSSPSAGGQVVNLQDIQQNMTFGFESFSGNVNYGLSHLPKNANAFLGLVLKDGSDVVAEIKTGDGAGLHQLDITSTGSAANYLTLALPDQPAGEGPTSLFLSGDAPLVISARGHAFRDLSYIDAKNAAGGITLDVDGAVPLEFFGGNGNDYLKLKQSDVDLVQIDGGAGIDALEISCASVAQLNGNVVRNVEELLLRGTLTASTSISNTAGFESIELLNRTTDYGHDLYLDGFSRITISDDQNSLVHLSGPATNVSERVTIEFEYGADIFGSLDISSLHYAELATDDAGQVVINNLMLMPSSFTDSTLSFRGTGNFKVGSVQGNIDLVDLSGLEGSWIGGDVFGMGTDFLVGDLTGRSTIWLDARTKGNSLNSEILFGAGESGSGLEGTVQIYEFDLIDPDKPALHDVLDLGRLGVSSIEDLSITIGHGDTLISSATGAFDGTIQLIGINLVNATGGPGAYIDLDGLLN